VRLELTGGVVSGKMSGLIEDGAGAEDDSLLKSVFGADLRRFNTNAIQPTARTKITIPAMVAPAIRPVLEWVLERGEDVEAVDAVEPDDEEAEGASSYLQCRVRQT
jgi:hypothetical protein